MKKVVYIAHPTSSDLAANLLKIACIFGDVAIEGEYIPFAPYFAAFAALDDELEEEREIGMRLNKEWFDRGIIDELWVYGLSEGVRQEIEWALENNVLVVYKIGGGNG